MRREQSHKILHFKNVHNEQELSLRKVIVGKSRAEGKARNKTQVGVGDRK